MTGNVVDGGRFKFEVQGLDDICLLVQDVALLELFAGDLLVDDAQLERVDFLVFGRQEHGADAHQVQILHL